MQLSFDFKNLSLREYRYLLNLGASSFSNSDVHPLRRALRHFKALSKNDPLMLVSTRV